MLHLGISGIGYGFVTIMRSALCVLRMRRVPLAFRVQQGTTGGDTAAGCGNRGRSSRRTSRSCDEWVGTTDGLVNATIRAQVTGYLISQDYKEGDSVKKGQMLFEIDPRPFQAALDQAQGHPCADGGPL